MSKDLGGLPALVNQAPEGLGPLGFDPGRFAVLIRAADDKRGVSVAYISSLKHFEESLDCFTPSHIECEYSAIPRECVLTGEDWFERTIDGAAHLPWIKRERLLAIAAGSRRAKTPQAVECEASQSGGKAASPNPVRNPHQEQTNG